MDRRQRDQVLSRYKKSSAPASDVNEEESRRFRLSCRMLRLAGHFDNQLPGQRRGESAIDWLVRLGLAKTPHAAAAALIEGQGLRPALDELLRLSEPF